MSRLGKNLTLYGRVKELESERDALRQLLLEILDHQIANRRSESARPFYSLLHLPHWHIPRLGC